MFNYFHAEIHEREKYKYISKCVNVFKFIYISLIFFFSLSCGRVIILLFGSIVFAPVAYKIMLIKSFYITCNCFVIYFLVH